MGAVAPHVRKDVRVPVGEAFNGDSLNLVAGAYVPTLFVAAGYVAFAGFVTAR